VLLRSQKLSVVWGLFSISLMLFLSGCGNALFNVKPRAELPPIASSARSATGGGITLRVAPLLNDEDSQEIFETNLPLSGVLPVRVELVYETGVPVEIKKARFRLSDGEGRQWKTLNAKQAVSLILKANEIYVYNPNSRKQLEKDMAASTLDLKPPLSNTDRRREGFLFFQSPDKRAVESPRGLVLRIEGVPESIEIKIN
jgi:hypothetical protein